MWQNDYRKGKQFKYYVQVEIPNGCYFAFPLPSSRSRWKEWKITHLHFNFCLWYGSLNARGLFFLSYRLSLMVLLVLVFLFSFFLSVHANTVVSFIKVLSNTQTQGEQGLEVEDGDSCSSDGNRIASNEGKSETIAITICESIKGFWRKTVGWRRVFELVLILILLWWSLMCYFLDHLNL